MLRRRYLTSLALALGGPALAGCAGSDDDAGVERHSEGYVAAFRDALEDEGHEVHELVIEAGVVQVEYAPAELTEEAIEESIRTGAYAYWERVHGGWKVDRLEARVVVGGDLVATWRVETEWVERHLAGDISRQELAAKVEASVERHDDESTG